MPFGGAIKTEAFVILNLTVSALFYAEQLIYSLLNFFRAKMEMMAKTKDKSKG